MKRKQRERLRAAAAERIDAERFGDHHDIDLPPKLTARDVAECQDGEGAWVRVWIWVPRDAYEPEPDDNEGDDE